MKSDLRENLTFKLRPLTIKYDWYWVESGSQILFVVGTVRTGICVILRRRCALSSDRFLCQVGKEADRAADQSHPLDVRHVAAVRVHQHCHRRPHLHKFRHAKSHGSHPALRSKA